jgi:hypothetical protein
MIWGTSQKLAHRSPIEPNSIFATICRPTQQLKGFEFELVVVSDASLNELEEFL